MFTLFKSIQIQTSSEGKLSRRRRRISSNRFFTFRNTCEFIREKNPSFVRIVANVSLIRVLIPHIWHRKNAMPTRNLHWIIIYTPHPLKFHLQPAQQRIHRSLHCSLRVQCWISVHSPSLLWLLPPLNSNSSNNSREKILILQHRNHIRGVHPLRLGRISPIQFRWRHHRRPRHPIETTTPHSKSKLEKFHRSVRRSENANVEAPSRVIKTILYYLRDQWIYSINNNWICCAHITRWIPIRMPLSYTKSPNVSAWVNNTFNIGFKFYGRVTLRRAIWKHRPIHSFQLQRAVAIVALPPARRRRRRIPLLHRFFLWLITIYVHH